MNTLTLQTGNTYHLVAQSRIVGSVNVAGSFTASADWTFGLIELLDLSGDFDLDGDVDGRDFLMWQRGESPDPLSATDLADWQSNFGAGTLTASVAVPEPSTATACVIAFSAYARLRRRDRPNSK
jgi:hypothetical protein